MEELQFLHWRRPNPRIRTVMLLPNSPLEVSIADYNRYQSYAQALSSGLLWISGGRSAFGANWWENAPSGRKSVRLESVDMFNEVLIIADIYNTPGRFPPLPLGSITHGSICGSWPAFWTTNLTQWPNGGEIDILEGVNNQVVDHYAFHTSANCKVSGQSQTGTIVTSNCDNNAAGQAGAGCGGYANSPYGTYGTAFRAQGGGVYAMDWRAEGIRIFVFPKSAIPADITSGNPNPNGWGKVSPPWFIFCVPLSFCL